VVHLLPTGTTRNDREDCSGAIGAHRTQGMIKYILVVPTGRQEWLKAVAEEKNPQD